MNRAESGPSLTRKSDCGPIMMTDAEKTLLSHLDPEELVDLTRRLVRLDSVIRPETGNTEHQVVEFLRAWLEDSLGLACRVDTVAPGRENCILTIDSGRPGRCLLLSGHTDVVSEGDASLWRYPPFEARVADNRIYGRGACDMKAGIAVILTAAKALLRSGFDFRGRLRLGFVCDEEDLMLGIKDFIRRGHADDVDAALIPEPEENLLCLRMKGALRARVKIQGKMAHGAMPLEGINPATRLARFILAVEAYEHREMQRCGKDEYLGWPSATVTVVQAPPTGEPAQLNVMPGEAHAYLDIRTTTRQDHEQIRQDLQMVLEELASRDPNFKACLEFFEDRPVVSVEKEEEIVMLAAGACRDITGKDCRYAGVPGATDGTFLRAWKNIPVLVWGPGPRHLPHQSDEYVQIDELVASARMVVLTAARYLSF
jgi:succinyl-diaminopimelate desuccinylase